MIEITTVIVGAGFSGLGAAIKLTQNGTDDFILLDRGSSFGGTWRDNSYPGAACDVPSHLYSYSFELNPNWSRSFSQQAEIHRYIEGVAAKHNIAAKTRFNTEVTGATWDESINRWIITTQDGDTYSAQFLLAGVGPLCEPNLPDIKGIGDFTGEVFHSARWNHDYDLKGKRVAVIGTGASAIQIIPEIAKVTGQLDVYQRTAPWVLPRFDRNFTEPELWAYKNIPGYKNAARALIYGSREVFAAGLTYLPPMLRPAQYVGRANIARGISDRKLRKAVTPKWAVGCKRILLSNTYYPALAQDNVELITTGIESVGTDSITTKDGTTRQYDAIVVATGFHVTDSPTFERIVGKGGVSLAETWQQTGMVGYKGSTVHGFPNMFLFVGPSTGIGHTSMVYIIESQLNYLIDMLKKVRRDGVNTFEVREEAQQEYGADIQNSLKRSVWVNGGCSSWYADENGNITTLWPGFTWRFRKLTREFDTAAYELTSVGSKESAGN